MAKKKQSRKTRISKESDVESNVSHNDLQAINEDINVPLNDRTNETLPKRPVSSLSGSLSSSSDTETDTSRNKSPLCNTVITVGSVSPRAYDGSTNVDEYLDHFSQIAKCNNWNAKLQLSRIPIYLSGPANLWYRSFMHEAETEGETPTIQMVFEGLRKEFRPQNHRTVYQSHLSSRKQGLNEAVQTYYYDILNLCMRVDPHMSEQDKLFYLCQGLKSTLLEKVMPFEPKTCKELLQKCKSIEEAEIMANNRPHYNYLLMNENRTVPIEPQKSTFEREDKIVKAIEAMGLSLKNDLESMGKNIIEAVNRRPSYRSNTGRPYRQVQTLDGQRVCFTCNNPGHSYRDCYLNNITAQQSNNTNQANYQSQGQARYGEQTYQRPNTPQRHEQSQAPVQTQATQVSPNQQVSGPQSGVPQVGNS